MTDEQFFGAYRVLCHRSANADTALRMLSRTDGPPSRPPFWCFLAIMDTGEPIVSLNLDLIAKYSIPFPVELTAGEQSDFKAIIFVLACDYYLLPLLRETKRYEPGIQDVFLKEVKPGDVVFDIGANLGAHSALLSWLTGKSGKIHAFEPESRNYELLSKMKDVNGFEQLVLHNYAAGDQTMTSSINPGKSNFGSNVILDNISAADEDIQKIDVRRLDDEFAGMPRFDFFKMDIEGYEEKALLGMRGLIEKHKPSIVLEFHPGWISQRGGEPHALMEWLFSIYGEALIIDNGIRYNSSKSLVDDLLARGGHVNLFLKRP